MKAATAAMSVRPRPQAKTGAIAAARSALRLLIRVIAAVSAQVAQAIRPNGQFSAITVPRNVATPLPPLKRSQMGKQWPKKAAPPARIAAVSPPKWRASRTAMAPLPESSSSVASAAPLLPVRSTLVAPMLPEPIWRRSPRPRARVMTRPKGTEPRR